MRLSTLKNMVGRGNTTTDALDDPSNDNVDTEQKSTENILRSKKTVIRNDAEAENDKIEDCLTVRNQKVTVRTKK